MATATRGPLRLLSGLALPGLAVLAFAAAVGSAPAQEPPHSAELDAAIIRAAKRHGVPEHLVRRIVMRESRYNPRARNHSFWGLMQISYPTARSMGFRGTPEQLLNPVTNLTYAVPYLANAFAAAGRREDAAVRLYASGYYATAKSRGLLGVLRTADSAPLNGVPDEVAVASVAPPPAETGWSLFGSSTPAVAPAPEPAPQQLAYAASPDPAAVAPAQAQIQAVAHAAPARAANTASDKIADKNSDDGVAMVAARDGTMTPPKRWQHDGGTSLIPRGEQGVEHDAAYRLSAAGVAPHGRRSHKTALFAQLDPPGGGAATATDAQPQPTAFYATAPVAPALGAQAVDPAQQAAARAAANGAAGTPATASDESPKSAHNRHRHAAATKPGATKTAATKTVAAQTAAPAPAN